MDSDGERGGGRRCKRSRRMQTSVHGLGTLNQKKDKRDERGRNCKQPHRSNQCWANQTITAGASCPGVEGEYLHSPRVKRKVCTSTVSPLLLDSLNLQLCTLNNTVQMQQDRKGLTLERVEGRMKKALWQPRDRGNAELITNPSPGIRQRIMTPTRRESLLIKVKGDQLSRWLPTNIRGNRMFNGLCTYRGLFSTPSPKLINRTGPC